MAVRYRLPEELVRLVALEPFAFSGRPLKAGCVLLSEYGIN